MDKPPEYTPAPADDIEVTMDNPPKYTPISAEDIAVSTYKPPEYIAALDKVKQDLEFAANCFLNHISKIATRTTYKFSHRGHLAVHSEKCTNSLEILLDYSEFFKPRYEGGLVKPYMLGLEAFFFYLSAAVRRSESDKFDWEKGEGEHGNFSVLAKDVAGNPEAMKRLENLLKNMSVYVDQLNKV